MSALLAKVQSVQAAAEALRIVDFNERQQRFYCRACRYRDPLVNGNKLHDDDCPWVHYVQSFKELLDAIEPELAKADKGEAPHTGDDALLDALTDARCSLESIEEADVDADDAVAQALEALTRADALRVAELKGEAAALDASPKGPLCRCPDNVCYLHPSLKTCGMRTREGSVPLDASCSCGRHQKGKADA
jgi:hypothetical protein